MSNVEEDDDDPLRALIGQELVGFELESILGEGGMAVVFRGRNVLDQRIVRAIKVVRPELALRKGFARRFAEEAGMLETLAHPNIVRFYGVRRERGFLVMELELLTGQTLRDRWQAGTRGDAKDVLDMLRQATEGVAAAHACGVVHRDLKPENLFVTTDGRIKVLDFGIARALESAEDSTRMTAVGSTLGTPAYMAPEICNGETATAASDVYALGLILYEGLAGHHPFTPPGAAIKGGQQMMFAQVNTPLPSLATVREDLTPALFKVIERASVKDPSNRLRDASALKEALVGVASSVERTTQGPSRVVSTELDIATFTPNAIALAAPAAEMERPQAPKDPTTAAAVVRTQLEIATFRAPATDKHRIKAQVDSREDAEPSTTPAISAQKSKAPIAAIAGAAILMIGGIVFLMTRDKNNNDSTFPAGSSSDQASIALESPSSAPSAAVNAPVTPSTTTTTLVAALVPASSVPTAQIEDASTAMTTGSRAVDRPANAKRDAGNGDASTPGATSAREAAEKNLELARDAAVAGNYAEVRRLLEPKVRTGRATLDEAALLKAACKEMSDRACVEDVRAKYPQL